MRKIIDLCKLEGKVYVYLSNKEVERKFLAAAEEEGFTFANGAKPTTASGEDLYLIYSNLEICNVGIIGHMAFNSKDIISTERRHYINYEKYITGADDYDDLRLEEEIKTGVISVI